MVQLKAMWEPGWVRFSKGKDPQKVADEIFAISDEPTKEQIVEMARDPEKECHDLFEWDDTTAAQNWRKEQAGLILRNLKVEFIQELDLDVEPKKFTPCRLFYGNPVNTEGFVAITKVMGNKDMYDQLLERAKMEIKSFRKKYAMLKELDALFEMIDMIE